MDERKYKMKQIAKGVYVDDAPDYDGEIMILIEHESDSVIHDTAEAYLTIKECHKLSKHLANIQERLIWVSLADTNARIVGSTVLALVGWINSARNVGASRPMLHGSISIKSLRVMESQGILKVV